MTSDLMSLWKYLTDNQKEGEIKLSYNNQILRKTIENKTTYYDIYNVNGLIICCDGERVSFIEKNEENSFCYKSENADECFILSSEEKQHCIVEVIV